MRILTRKRPISQRLSLRAAAFLVALALVLLPRLQAEDRKPTTSPSPVKPTTAGPRGEPATGKAQSGAKPEKLGPEWIRDLEQAKKLAKAQGKDLLMVFTGIGWCAQCMVLDKEILQTKEFLIPASKEYILVELDYTFGDTPAEKQREERLRKLQQQYLTPGVPTIVLADAQGIPYAYRTGHSSGSRPATVLFAFRQAQRAKSQHNQCLEKAATLTGWERADQLHKAVSAVEPFLGSIEERGDDAVLTFYKSQVEEILRLVPAKGSSLRNHYESHIARTKEWHAREAVFAHLKEFRTEQDYPRAIAYIASALETIKDKDVRWRLERSRQVYLEWSHRHEEALANVHRLQKLPDLSDVDREFLLDRESYNLFNLKHYEEGLALYDRRIEAAKGDAKKRLKLLDWKAQMSFSHKLPTQQTIPLCLEYRRATEPRSERWQTASYFLAAEYRRAGQHQEAIKVLEEVLAIERQPGTWLSAAESYLALGQVERAKAYIGDAKKSAAALKLSERKMDRDIAANLERRIADLEKRLGSPQAKQ